MVDFISETDTSTAETRAFREDVINGLSQSPKQLKCKYLYDKRGSELFDAICETNEYYLTRTELAIMHEHGQQMATAIGSHALVIELGSGSSLKTPLLLEHLQSPAAYVPVDIAEQHLLAAADAIAARFPEIPVMPVCADFTQPFAVPEPPQPVRRRAVYFPGSTIGNFEPDHARKLLTQIADLVGRNGGLLVGFDLQKDVDTLEAAYNDHEGVTATFNRNLLVRMKNELGAEVSVEQFNHRAEYNAKRGRIESYLVSAASQRIAIGEHRFSFEPGERIHSENSYKYTLESFTQLAQACGFARSRIWTDPNVWFAVGLFETDS